MSNSIEYAKIFTNALDKVMISKLTSAPMELNSKLIKYNGGNEVKIPKIVMEGLADYDRANGYATGAVTVSWQTRALTQDRGKKFLLDAMDVDESNFVATAGNAMGEFQRTKVVPEIDAYRYSKIFGYANNVLKTGSYVPATATIFEQLDSDIADIQDVVGEDEAMTIYMSRNARHVLDMADKIEKRIDVGTNGDGSVNTKIKSLDGINIITVPRVRFKSSYTFGADGFTADAVAMNLNWIIAVNKSLIAVNKQNKMKIFSPDKNLDADAWSLSYRRYHDLFITDNGLDGVYVSYTPIEAPALTATVAAGSASGTTKFTATPDSGNTLGYILGAESAGVKYNDVYTGSAYTSGADIAAVEGQYLTMLEVDSNGHVVKAKEEVLESGDITA